jgi:hypothetical protein
MLGFRRCDAVGYVSIDESGRNGAVAQIKDVRAAGTAERARDLDDGVVFYQDFRRAEHRVARAVEQFPADDDCFRHCGLPLPVTTPRHWGSDIRHRWHPALGFLGTFPTGFCGTRIVWIPDFRNRKPPAAPDRHDAEREACNQRYRRHRGDG